MSEAADLARAGEILPPGELWSAVVGDAPEWLASLPPRCADLVFFSPPYEGQRTYGISFKRKGQVWVDWMREVIQEAARVSAGLVCVNAACPVRDFKYSPALEWLVADLTRLDGMVCGPSPYAWVKSEDREDAKGNGIPGSGGEHYQRRDWEPVYAFCLPDRLPLKWSDNTAFGTPPVCGPGGEMSNRMANGRRVNDPWKTASRGGSNCGGRYQNGKKRAGTRVSTGAGGNIVHTDAQFSVPKIANPGNVIRVPVGGGKLGHAAAHKSEAPMSLPLAERFVCWFVPPGGVVIDPFLGSGTTLDAALQHGRRGLGCDVRPEQVEIARARLRTVTPNLFAPVAARTEPTAGEPQPGLFDDVE